MDPDRFDALVQSLARSGSRRRLLGGLLAGSLAPLPAAAKDKRHRSGPAGASASNSHPLASASAAPGSPQPAACLPVGKRCTLAATAGADHGKGKHGGKGGKGKHHPPACTKCCSRYGAAGSDGKARCACKGEGEACANPSQCCGGLCPNGQCTACPDDLTACTGNCVDLQTNAQHCGNCTTACASGQRCVNGTCVCDGTSCPRGCCAQDGSCQRGTSDQACGVGGADCQTCGTCMTCDGTTCANATGCCGDASVCQSGNCVACASGQRCQGGACICDATSCPDGCCAGSTCVKFADQTDQQCGTGGATCAACTGNDTCGGGSPGTPGVCGCTLQCDGKTCGESNNCGGTCTSCPDECQTCDGSICQNKPDGTDCGGAGSGLHCCQGVCPPPCLPTGTCCDPSQTCAQCCSGAEQIGDRCSETSGWVCHAVTPGGPCVGDGGCTQLYGSTICRCGRCCVKSGSIGFCRHGDAHGCCSGACNGGFCT